MRAPRSGTGATRGAGSFSPALRSAPRLEIQAAENQHPRWTRDARPSRSALATAGAQLLADQKRVERRARPHRVRVGAVYVLVARLELGERFQKTIARLA